MNFTTVPPQTALVLPLAVSQDNEQWANRTVTAGVIIDRVRLIELLEELPDDEMRDMVDARTREWVAREVASVA